ncbi:MAG: glycosyltransferase [Phycisphaerae bacterium]|nr:glycosyltransferase [Phycisphaerae bacterium]
MRDGRHEYVISVIVCTYNRADVLARMLGSFVAQPGLARVPYELIVIDNNSTDHTHRILERFSPAVRLRTFLETRQGLSHARNRGLKEAGGDVVAFLDDDVLVQADWIERLHDCFAATGADVVGGRATLLYERTPPAWLGPYFRRALSEVDLGPERRCLDSGRRLYGLNLAFRRTALIAAGGFNPALGRTGADLLCGEETAVIRRIVESGGAVVYDPFTVVAHCIDRGRLAWSYFERQSVGAGRSDALADPPGSVLQRLRYACESCHALWNEAVRLACATAFGKTSYEWRMAKSRFLRTATLLLCRIRRIIIAT